MAQRYEGIKSLATLVLRLQTMEPTNEPIVKVKSNFPSLTVFFGLVILFSALFIVFKSLPDSGDPTAPEVNAPIIRQALSETDASIIDDLPLAAELENESVVDAEKIFAFSRASAVFDMGDRTVDYLVRILDSESPDFDPYKTIAAYFLVHTYYDTNRDIVFMANAVKKSTFMEGVTEKAKTFFPELFEIPLESLSIPESSLYFASYLFALSERPDSVAVPGNAALELARAYAHIEQNPDSPLREITSTSTLAVALNEQYNLMSNRIEARNLPLNNPSAHFAYDTLVGINTVSNSITLLRLYGLDQNFPILTEVNIAENFEYATVLAREDAFSLYMFTNYLYLRYMILFEPNTPETNEKIEELVENIIGVYPYEYVTNNSWVMGALRYASPTNSVYGSYFQSDMKALAERNNNFKTFLSHVGIVFNE